MKSSLYNLNFTNQTIKLIVSFLAILFFSKKIHHACVSFYYFFKDINGTIMKFMMSFFMLVLTWLLMSVHSLHLKMNWFGIPCDL